MKRMTKERLFAVMREAASQGDRDTYDKLWKAITWLWNLGLVNDKIYSAMIHEDQRLFETGEAEPMCDGISRETALEALCCEEEG